MYKRDCVVKQLWNPQTDGTNFLINKNPNTIRLIVKSGKDFIIGNRLEVKQNDDIVLLNRRDDEVLISLSKFLDNDFEEVYYRIFNLREEKIDEIIDLPKNLEIIVFSNLKILKNEANL